MVVTGGVWLLNHETGQLTYLEAHPGSTVRSHWPAVDRRATDYIRRGSDWLLSAAGGGVESLNQALRGRFAGDRIGLPLETPLQSDFWYRQLTPGSLGAQARMFTGDGAEGSILGLLIDDSKDGDTVAGWAGGDTTFSSATTAPVGQGPGRGLYPASSSGGGVAVALRRQVRLPLYPAWVAKRCLLSLCSKPSTPMTTHGEILGVWQWAGGSINTAGDGGDSGGGVLRQSISDLTETTSRTLAGSNGGGSSNISGGGGGGAGGVYLALCVGSYVLQSGRTISAVGGAGGLGSSGTGHGGVGGNGHVILFFGDTATITARSAMRTPRGFK